MCPWEGGRERVQREEEKGERRKGESVEDIVTHTPARKVWHAGNRDKQRRKVQLASE